MNSRRRHLLQGLLALTLVFISCDVSTLAGPQVPTVVPGAVDTIVVMTAQAAGTQTAALLPPTLTPTLTPVPTHTPSLTPSPTATFLFLLATIARTPTAATAPPSGKDFSCALTDQSPGDGAVVTKNQNFSVTWTVQNTGTSSWDSNSVDFVYASGAKLTSTKGVDLPKSVGPGESIPLKVTMQAPGSGTYKTVWTLRNGKDVFCRVSLSIVVQ